METVKFEDFKKLDIRIGKIISAEKVENTDKLLKLKISFGKEKRQIIAGIAESYSPEEIIGKQIPVIINLEPRILKGLESQGMILAADSEGKPVLLHPNKKVPDGSVVR